MKKAARVRAKDGGNSAERKKNRSFYSSLPLINWLRASEIDFKQSLDGEPVDFRSDFLSVTRKTDLEVVRKTNFTNDAS